FTFWSPVAPRTPFEGVRELPPGTFEIFDLSSPKPVHSAHTYFDPRFLDRVEDAARSNSPDALATAAGATLASLGEATRLRMVRPDVPVGSYLSGGLDSSLVAALGLKAKGERFKTFSLRFADAEFDETEFQECMVGELGSEHASVVVSREDIANAFRSVVFHA